MLSDLSYWEKEYSTDLRFSVCIFAYLTTQIDKQIFHVLFLAWIGTKSSEKLI